MTTDDKLAAIVIAIRMAVEHAQTQSELNAMQGKLNKYLLEIVETQQNAIHKLRDRLNRVEAWRQN